MYKLFKKLFIKAKRICKELEIVPATAFKYMVFAVQAIHKLFKRGDKS